MFYLLTLTYLFSVSHVDVFRPSFLFWSRSDYHKTCWHLKPVSLSTCPGIMTIACVRVFSDPESMKTCGTNHPHCVDVTIIFVQINVSVVQGLSSLLFGSLNVGRQIETFHTSQLVKLILHQVATRRKSLGCSCKANLQRQQFPEGRKLSCNSSLIREI